MRRWRGYRTALVAMAVMGMLAGAATAFAPAASASGPATHDPHLYLALGDSVPFGYSPLLAKPGVDPSVFVGYPQLAAARLRPRLSLFNASCPGETSTSLIMGTRPDNGCQNYRQLIGPLHVAYSGSQLGYATTFLAAHPRTDLVTMMIGANDLFVLQNSCATNADPTTCLTNGVPGVLATLAGNLQTIYSSLRQAGLSGRLVAVSYYSLNYADPAGTAVAEQLDATLSAVTRAFGGTVADGFGAFKAAAAPFGGDPCAAGLLIRLTATRCDVHPSPAGAALLADALVRIARPGRGRD